MVDPALVKIFDASTDAQSVCGC